jgi:uncharacterized protein (DUF302 family)
MSVVTESIGISVYLNSEYDSAVERVTAELKKEGFGILTEIDVKATLKQKLDVDFRPYKILGACNPPLAYRALQAVPEVGLLLPCNVTVSQEENDRVLVSILNPNLMAEVIANPKLAEVAKDAEERLRRVAVALDVV